MIYFTQSLSGRPSHMIYGKRSYICKCFPYDQFYAQFVGTTHLIYILRQVLSRQKKGLSLWREFGLFIKDEEDGDEDEYSVVDIDIGDILS